jgi:hypothetical protein
MENCRMPLPGSWISATYLVKKISTKLYSAEYTITREKVFLFPCVAETQQHCGLNVTITNKDRVYAPAERAEKLPLFSPLPFSPLWYTVPVCGDRFINQFRISDYVWCACGCIHIYTPLHYYVFNAVFTL